MKRSIATVTMSGTLPEKLRAAATAGFEGIELCEADIGDIPSAAIASMAADLGLKIDVLQPFRNLEGISQSQHKLNLEQVDRIFDRMNEIAATTMLVCSNATKEVIGDDNLSAAQLYDLAEKAAARNVSIGFEALSWGSHVATFDHGYRIVMKANHPSLGLVVDSFHTLALPFQWTTIEEVDPCKIAYVQLADAKKIDVPLIEWSRHYRCLPGEGNLDVAGFLSRVLATGYKGPISLEIFSDELKLLSPTEIAHQGMQSLLLLEKQMESVDLLLA